jgi:glycerate kinase
VEAAGLDEALRGAWAVLTGEGRLDVQSTYGKGPVEVARRARAMGVRAFLLAGTTGDGWEAVLDEGVTLVETLSPPGQELTVSEMESRAAELLSLAAERACRRVLGTP